MTPPAGPPPPPRRPWGWYALATGGAVLAVVILVVIACRVESSSDFRDFWNNARHFRQTGEIADNQGVHNYLPFFTIFMAPWGYLPLRVAAVLFVALSLALFALTAGMVETLLRDLPGGPPRRALLVTLLLALPYVYACGVVGNLGLLLLFLVSSVWLLVERGREWEAGVALGLATLIKVIPAVLLVFFLLRRRWRAAGGAVATIVVLGLGAPLLTVGWQRTIDYHRAFYERAVQEHSALQTLTATQPRKAHFNNNALPMVLRRLLTPLDGGTEQTRRPLRVNLASWSPAGVVAAYGIITFTILVLSILATLRRAPPWPPDERDQLAQLRVQFGMWCGVMLLASPLVWTHYLPLAYWPLAVVADRAERTARAGRRPDPICMLALLGWLVGAGLLAWPTARAAGAQIWSVALLWAATVVVLLRKGK